MQCDFNLPFLILRFLLWGISSLGKRFQSEMCDTMFALLYMTPFEKKISI